MKKTSTNNNSFSEKHPVANFVLGCFILFSLLIAISSLLFLFAIQSNDNNKPKNTK